MCGLNGIVRLSSDAPPVSRAELLATRDAMATRGPDGAGLWLSPGGTAGFAHRRLAILDLSDAAAQPMVSADGRRVVVFNGEIYNFRELRAALESDGVAFRTSSDTEVLLALWERRGLEIFASLRGMYALALWDEAERRLVLARDPDGIKPLYYAVSGGVLRFGSQVKALEAGGGVPTGVDPAGLVGFLSWGSVPEPFTIRRAVHSLPAGHLLEVVGGALRTPVRHAGAGPLREPIDVGDEELDIETAASEAGRALEESVHAHLVSDVPVALFLSAGLDSALVLALATAARAEGSAPFAAFTVAFDDFRGTPYDEAPGAAEAAALFGARHVVRRVSTEAWRERSRAAAAAMDQPTVDGANTFVVAGLAREAGIKVALSGLGGDELFGGYPSFADVPRWVAKARLGGHLPGLGKVWPSLARALRPDVPKLAGFFRYGRELAGAYFLRRALLLPGEVEALLGPRLAAEGFAAYEPIADAARVLAEAEVGVVEDAGERAWRAVHLLESALYMRNQLLRDTDWASMAHSVEVRVPFVDVPLRRALARLRFQPARRLGKAGLVRRLAPTLPERLLDRPKTGFHVPAGGGDASGPPRFGRASRVRALDALEAFGIPIERPAALAAVG